MQLFLAREPLVSIDVDILRPLPRPESGRIFLLVITDRFIKFPQAVLLRERDVYTVVRAFAEE